jgi:hypothetical protein
MRGLKMFNFFKRKNVNRRFEFIPNKGIKVLNNGLLLKLGMVEKDIIGILLEDKGSKKDTIFIYSDKKEERIDRSIWYNNGSINLVYKNNILSFIQFPEGVELYFNKIKLTNKDYSKTLNSLKRLGYSWVEDNDDGSIINELNMSFYHPYDSELETVSFYTDDYYTSDEERSKYTIESSNKDGKSLIKFLKKD